MSRIIKFRVWDIDSKTYRKVLDLSWYQNGEFEGARVEMEPGHPRFSGHEKFLLAKDIILEQFTNLLDKNGEEIYDAI